MTSNPYADARAAAADAFITLPEVAARMGRSESWVYERAKAGDFPFVKRIGSRYLANRRAFERWLTGEEMPEPAAPIALVAAERSQRDLALAAIDRKLAEHEQEMALLRFHRDILRSQSADARTA